MIPPTTTSRACKRRRNGITMSTMDQATLQRLEEIRTEWKAVAAKRSPRLIRCPSAEKLFANLPQNNQHRQTLPQQRPAMPRRQSVVLIDSRCDVKQLDFDILGTQKTMSQVVFELYESFGLLRTFGISEVVFNHFIASVKSGYSNMRHNKGRKKSDPAYHSFKHAVDVAQAVCMFLHSTELQGLLTPLNKFSLLTAALCHDIGHGGWSNAFLAATRTDISDGKDLQLDPDLIAEYGKDSTLERYHTDLSMLLLTKQEKGIAFLQQFDLGQRQEVLQDVCELILATDMAGHEGFAAALADVKGRGGFQLPHRHNVNVETAKKAAKAEARLLMKCVLKVADISNIGRPFDVGATWAHSLALEFEAQGNQEQRHGIPVSPLNQSTTASKARMTGGFIDFLAGPFVRDFADALALAQSTQSAVQVVGPEYKPQQHSTVQAFAAAVVQNREFWRKVQVAEDAYQHQLDSQVVTRHRSQTSPNPTSTSSSTSEPSVVPSETPFGSPLHISALQLDSSCSYGNSTKDVSSGNNSPQPKRRRSLSPQPKRPSRSPSSAQQQQGRVTHSICPRRRGSCPAVMVKFA